MGAANPTPLDKLRREDAPRGSQATISAPTPDDNMWQQFKTLISNPFDGARALVNDARTSIRESVGLDNDNITSGPYANLSNLRRANESTDEQTQETLNRSSAINSASSMIPAALTAQTLSDAVSGNFVSLATKKFNKIPGVKEVIKNPELARNIANTAYTTLKINKNVQLK